MRRSIRFTGRMDVVILALLIMLSATSLVAQIPKGDITIELEPVASGLTAPLGVTHAGDQSGRLTTLDDHEIMHRARLWQSGQIRIVEDGELLPTPFLDISGRLPALNPFFDERGLLGLAFHPRYKRNGRFFVRYSAPREGDPSEPCFDTSRGCHAEVLAEYAVSDHDPNLADASSERILFQHIQ